MLALFNKLSYIDLTFGPWQKVVVTGRDREQYSQEDYSHQHGWISAMAAQKKVVEWLGHAPDTFSFYLATSTSTISEAPHQLIPAKIFPTATTILVKANQTSL